MTNHDPVPPPASPAEPADWSGLPRDLYVTNVRRIDRVVWEATLCSVPMAIGPEVRYSLAAAPPDPVAWLITDKGIQWVAFGTLDLEQVPARASREPLYLHPPARPQPVNLREKARQVLRRIRESNVRLSFGPGQHVMTPDKFVFEAVLEALEEAAACLPTGGE